MKRQNLFTKWKTKQIVSHCNLMSTIRRAAHFEIKTNDFFSSCFTNKLTNKSFELLV